jgi:hypothetical protein
MFTVEFDSRFVVRLHACCMNTFDVDDTYNMYQK